MKGKRKGKKTSAYTRGKVRDEDRERERENKDWQREVLYYSLFKDKRRERQNKYDWAWLKQNKAKSFFLVSILKSKIATITHFFVIPRIEREK